MLSGPAAEQQYAKPAWLFSGQNAISPEHCKVTLLRRKGCYSCLRKRSGNKGVASIGSAACAHQEDHVLATL
jgi:hypothetical protein